MIPLVHRSAARRAYDGARRTVLPAFGAGAIAGLVAGIPIVTSAGAGAVLGLVLGATLGAIRVDPGILR